MDKIKRIEKEVSRIEKILSKSNKCPNPFYILDVDHDEYQKDNKILKKQYYKLALLLHPDKHDNIKRFEEVFIYVSRSYKWIEDNNVSKKQYYNPGFWQTIWQKKPIILDDEIDKQTNSKKDINYKITKWINENSKDLMVFDESNQKITLSLKNFKEIVQTNPDILKVNIEMTGAEHTKNKCNSKKGKHDKGLKQRATQKKNAERRLINHGFCFSNKISLESFE